MLAGMVTGSLPDGAVSPKRTDAHALPVRSPPRNKTASAATSSRHGVSTGPGTCSSTTTGLPSAATAAMSSSAPSARDRSGRSRSSEAVAAPTTITTSAWLAASRAAARRPARDDSRLGVTTRMPAIAARRWIPASGVTTSGEATWPEPPPEYGLPGPHWFIVSPASAATPTTASVRIGPCRSGSVSLLFLRRTTASAASSPANCKCACVRTLVARSASQGNSQPCCSSKRR
mmetsp:Transcript_91150/g.262926  ORF Transcript_91150/g.262926 Transcript_91150/m.262926 type:complete len:232 (-) Transcript_91150:1087-1782(-)